MSHNRDPRQVIWMLNELFTEMDALATKHGIDRIKTIGDAYMAVSGAPLYVENHQERMALFGLDILRLGVPALESAEPAASDDASRSGGDGKNGEDLGERASVRMRVGMHCGPVIAGVVGTSKFGK